MVVLVIVDIEVIIRKCGTIFVRTQLIFVIDWLCLSRFVPGRKMRTSLTEDSIFDTELDSWIQTNIFIGVVTITATWGVVTAIFKCFEWCFKNIDVVEFRDWVKVINLPLRSRRSPYLLLLKLRNQSSMLNRRRWPQPDEIQHRLSVSFDTEIRQQIQIILHELIILVDVRIEIALIGSCLRGLSQVSFQIE